MTLLACPSYRRSERRLREVALLLNKDCDNINSHATWVLYQFMRSLKFIIDCIALCSARSCPSSRPLFVQVVSQSPPFSWSPWSSFIVVWSPIGDISGPSVVVGAVDEQFVFRIYSFVFTHRHLNPDYTFLPILVVISR